MQPFEKITQLTDVAEGTIVRCITRLDETCREVRDAARVIGDAELFKKMEEAQIKIKRDSECHRCNGSIFGAHHASLSCFRSIAVLLDSGIDRFQDVVDMKAPRSISKQNVPSIPCCKEILLSEPMSKLLESSSIRGS